MKVQGGGICLRSSVHQHIRLRAFALDLRGLTCRDMRIASATARLW